ncbi:reverse transcriptase domain-containing protein [Tanacetum coccineum]
MLTSPKEKEELIMYLVAAKESISAVLMTERDGKQMPIYFVSCALQGPEVNYTPMEKLILALFDSGTITFSIRSDEIGADRTASIETLMNHLQVMIDHYSTWGDVVQVDTWVASSGKHGMRHDWLLRDSKVGEILTRASRYKWFLHPSPIRIHYYSVTPISVRAGLVQWVDYVTRIYSVYKSWQYRVQAAQVSVVAFSNGKNSLQEHLPRSTEMF